MTALWRLLRFVPLPVITFVKRHSSSRARFWVRQTFGAGYDAIPDAISRMPDGRVFHIGPDYAYWSIYMGVGHEPETSRIVQQLVRAGDTAVDVGANYGWYTTLLGRAVQDTGRVFAFEPVPSTYERLVEHVALNRLEGCVNPVRAAVSDTPGTASVYVFNNLSHGCASLAPLDAGEHRAANPGDYFLIQAPMLRLDQYLHGQGVDSVDFLKCDAEGSELPALKGCGELLRRADAPLILVELNDDASVAFGYRKADLWGYLADLGYEHFFEIASGDRLRRVMRIEDVHEANILCAKPTGMAQRITRSEIAIGD